MKRFIIAALIGLAAGYLLMRLSRRRLLSEELSEDDEPDEGTAPAPAP
jgi:uncharacterized membrane-anchored protein YhcB (DUF1043 family)